MIIERHLAVGLDSAFYSHLRDVSAPSVLIRMPCWWKVYPLPKRYTNDSVRRLLLSNSRVRMRKGEQIAERGRAEGKLLWAIEWPNMYFAPCTATLRCTFLLYALSAGRGRDADESESRLEKQRAESAFLLQFGHRIIYGTCASWRRELRRRARPQNGMECGEMI